MPTDTAADPDTGEIIDAETEDITTDPLDTPATPTHMLSLLPASSDMTKWTEEQAALLDFAGLVQRKGNAPPVWAPRATIAAFLHQCKRTGLDPVARQIYCIERAGKWQIQVSIDGARLVAQRSGEYRGQTPAQWTGDGVTWYDVWLFDVPPKAARVGVYRKDFVEPLIAVARWDSYAVYVTDYRTKAQKLAAMWQKMPDVMLSKVAEMLALRKAFPQDLSGLYSSEEMEQAGPATSAPAAIEAPQASVESPPERVSEDVPPTASDTPSTEPQGEERWVPWKKLIDDTRTVLQVQQVTQSLFKAGILQLKVPGSTITVEEYVTQHRDAIEDKLPKTRKPRSIKDRVAAGLKNDAVVVDEEPPPEEWEEPNGLAGDVPAEFEGGQDAR